MKTQPLIQISHLKFSYGSEPFLHVPEFTLSPAEKVFVEGPSGSGKTTWLEILSGLLRPQSGSYQFNNQDVLSLSESSRDLLRQKDMSLIFQSFNLVPYLSVTENILLPFVLGARHPISETETQQAMQSYLEKMDLASVRNEKVAKLSQGQAQRIAAIRALIKKPQLILADEPTSSLDAKNRDVFLKNLFTLCAEQKTGLLFVSHDHSLKSHFDRVVSILEWRV